MAKTTKQKKKVSTPKTKSAAKPKKEAVKAPIKISKNYIPKETEKYMCEKHQVYFRMKLNEWRKELIKANNEAYTMVVWMIIVFQQILSTKQVRTLIKMLK